MGRHKHNYSRRSDESHGGRSEVQSAGKFPRRRKATPSQRGKSYTRASAPSATPRSADAGASTSSSSSTAQDETESDIPGFYYDKEKKAYFKILPSSMSSVSSFVTKESIKRKENEKQRVSDVKKLLSGESDILRRALFSPNQSTSHSSSGLTEVLSKLQCGQVTCENFRTYMNRHRCSTLLPDAEISSYGPNQNSMRLEDLQKMLSTVTRDHLVCVWSLRSSIAQCIQLLSVSSDLRPQRKHSRGLDETPAASPPPAVIRPLITTEPIFKKISSVCWASFPGLLGAHPTVLYTATCPVGYSPTIVYAHNFDVHNNSTVRLFELNLGFSTVWSSAWHSFEAQFSVGSERKCHLIDVATRRTWTYFTHNSDPLAQAFSPTDPHKMYNGTRGGSIVVHDIRCPGKSRSQQEMRQKHGIGCLRLLRDENYVMASDFSGEIVNWDQRMTRIVRKYEGLVNSHYQLPFHLDELESIVCGAGSDSYSKLWDVRSGSLLQSIPPPCPVSLDSFPIAMYSQRWGNADGNSGLIVGIKNCFKVYC